MKLLLIISLLCANPQPGTDSTKAEPKKKSTAAPKPQTKKQKAGLPFFPFIIDNR
jgi:hypothetical protein